MKTTIIRSEKEQELKLERLTNEEQKQFDKLVEKATKKAGTWKPIRKPIRGEDYWYIDSRGIVYQTRWMEDQSDNYRYETGNCTKTKEESEFNREKALVCGKWTRLAKKSWDGEEIDWSNGNNQKKYFLDYCCNNEAYSDFIYYYDLQSDLFKSEKSLFAAVNEVGKENVIKYLLK